MAELWDELNEGSAEIDRQIERMEEEKAPREVQFAHSPIAFDCPVPVTADGDTFRDGEPIPIDERTTKCGASAPYLIGAQIVCEKHLRQACDLMGLDPDDILRDLVSVS